MSTLRTFHLHIPLVQEGTVAIVTLLGKQKHSQDSAALLKRGKRQLEEEMRRVDEKLDESEKVEMQCGKVLVQGQVRFMASPGVASASRAKHACIAQVPPPEVC